MREKINISGTTLDLVLLMSEGNPGASTVLAGMLQHSGNGAMSILTLDDMNIRGTHIWVGYKDHCKQNMDDFVAAIDNRDPDMIDTINKECLQFPGFTERAVIGGGS